MSILTVAKTFVESLVSEIPTPYKEQISVCQDGKANKLRECANRVFNEERDALAQSTGKNVYAECKGLQALFGKDFSKEPNVTKAFTALDDCKTKLGGSVPQDTSRLNLIEIQNLAKQPPTFDVLPKWMQAQVVTVSERTGKKIEVAELIEEMGYKTNFVKIDGSFVAMNSLDWTKKYEFIKAMPAGTDIQKKEKEEAKKEFLKLADDWWKKRDFEQMVAVYEGLRKMLGAPAPKNKTLNKVPDVSVKAFITSEVNAVASEAAQLLGINEEKIDEEIKGKYDGNFPHDHSVFDFDEGIEILKQFATYLNRKLKAAGKTEIKDPTMMPNFPKNESEYAKQAGALLQEWLNCYNNGKWKDFIKLTCEDYK